MAQTPKNQAAMKELGEHLARLHEALPPAERPWRIIAARILETQGVSISYEQLRKMHAGQVDPTSSKPEHMIALAKFYGKNSDALGPHAARRLGDLLALTQNWKKMRGRPMRTEATDVRAPSAA